VASDISGAEAAIRATQARATRLVAGVDRTGRASLHRLLGTLQAADARLGERLRRDAAMLGGETARFTGAQATVYRAQVRLAIREVEAGLAGIVLGQSNHAIDSAGRDAVKLVKTLERRFAGDSPRRSRSTLRACWRARGRRSSRRSYGCTRAAWTGTGSR